MIFNVLVALIALIVIHLISTPTEREKALRDELTACHKAKNLEYRQQVEKNKTK